MFSVSRSSWSLQSLHCYSALLSLCLMQHQLAVICLQICLLVLTCPWWTLSTCKHMFVEPFFYFISCILVSSPLCPLSFNLNHSISSYKVVNKSFTTFICCLQFDQCLRTWLSTIQCLHSEVIEFPFPALIHLSVVFDFVSSIYFLKWYCPISAGPALKRL